MAAFDRFTGRSALERALDKALAIPAARIEERIARMRRDRPGADTAELVELAASRRPACRRAPSAPRPRSRQWARARPRL